MDSRSKIKSQPCSLPACLFVSKTVQTHKFLASSKSTLYFTLFLGEREKPNQGWNHFIAKHYSAFSARLDFYWTIFLYNCTRFCYSAGYFGEFEAQFLARFPYLQNFVARKRGSRNLGCYFFLSALKSNGVVKFCRSNKCIMTLCRFQ